MSLSRRASLALLVGLCMAGCSSTPSPPVRYYRLSMEPPENPATSTPSVPREIWQLLSVRMPDYLDRDELWFATGANAVQASEGHRWLEPLRDAVPRVLRNDLGALRGTGSVWSGSVPAGVVVARQVRVEVLELAPEESRRAVRLRARWTSVDPNGSTPARVNESSISAPSAGPEPTQLVEAYRLALWRLAERIAQPAAS